MTKLGVLRLRVARSRKRSFLPQVVTKFQPCGADLIQMNPRRLSARHLDPADGTGWWGVIAGAGLIV